jgi:hypothetical protein
MMTTNGTHAPIADERGELFPEAYPRVSIKTAVACEGFTFEITFNDASLADALNVLRKRNCTPAGVPNGTPAERVPAQDANGVPTCMNRNCSNYGKPMAPSQHEGYYCKGKDARTGNTKGYCKETA